MCVNLVCGRGSRRRSTANVRGAIAALPKNGSHCAHSEPPHLILPHWSSFILLVAVREGKPPALAATPAPQPRQREALASIASPRRTQRRRRRQKTTTMSLSRRQVRLRREYLYRRSLEGREKEVYEKKRKVAEALAAGRPSGTARQPSLSC